MKRPKSLPGGSLEYRVLASLWQAGRASAPEVHASVGEPEGLVYTTVAKVLDRLHAKGLVKRERVGRAFVYRPVVERETVERATLGATLRRVLGEEPRAAMASLVDAVEAIDPNLLDDLARAVSVRRRKRRGS
jgi:BlaI family penicillinase repressor